MSPVFPIVILVVLVFAGLFAYIGWLAFFKPPLNHPAQFFRRGRQPDTNTLVVCAGDSLTHATISADYVALLRQRFGNQGYEFVNAGVNSDLAYNLLQRLDTIIACQPDVVTILIGTNDVNATFDINPYRHKNLPTSPNKAWYQQNLETIVRRFQEETDARIILLSPPILSEDLSHDANRKIRDYTVTVREVADAANVMYVPLNEAFQSQLKDERGAAPYESGVRLTFSTIGSYYLRGKSWDDIAERNGFKFLTDHIHLNDQGAKIIARLIGEALTSISPPV